MVDKRDNFKFSIVNFPNLSGNIPTNQSYGVFISQLVRYARCCQKFVDFQKRTQSLVQRLLKQHFKLTKLCSTFNKFCSKYSRLLKHYKKFRLYDLNALLTYNGDEGDLVCSKNQPPAPSLQRLVFLQFRYMLLLLYYYSLHVLFRSLFKLISFTTLFLILF